MRWIMPMLALMSSCAPTTSSTMGTPVSGEVFEGDVVGQVMSFVLPVPGSRRPSSSPMAPRSTMGEALNGIGRWRQWDKGYCAYYPWLGSEPGLRPPFSGPVESDGYRCYVVRAESGYYVLFQPDGTYVGTLVPVPG